MNDFAAFALSNELDAANYDLMNVNVANIYLQSNSKRPIQMLKSEHIFSFYLDVERQTF